MKSKIDYSLDKNNGLADQISKSNNFYYSSFPIEELEKILKDLNDSTTKEVSIKVYNRKKWTKI